MNVRTAELAAVDGHNQDRVFIGANAVVVLDGASGTDAAVTVADYVDVLGAHLVKLLDTNTAQPLPQVLTDALSATVAELDISVGHSPSSTVAIVRATEDTVDVLVLCDSVIYVATDAGIEVVTDDRLAQTPSTNRSAALAWLAAGSGFDEVHQRLLRAMNTEKAPKRNVPGGYWVAEANPDAGRYALVRSFRAADVHWCALLTDGADDTMRQLGVAIEQAATLSEAQLAELLARLHRWEAGEDPDGVQLPRFKRHDDKTIAIVDFR